MCKNFVQHTINEEGKFWKIDFVVEEVMDNMRLAVMMITGETSYELSTDYNDVE